MRFRWFTCSSRCIRSWILNNKKAAPERKASLRTVEEVASGKSAKRPGTDGICRRRTTASRPGARGSYSTPSQRLPVLRGLSAFRRKHRRSLLLTLSRLSELSELPNLVVQPLAPFVRVPKEI
ncbi:unnamed protein product [Citrullus colocynthis]|uniref:Uncharacterized protein n=1 Tax=Citrullus colocynthis TaxID=252529 RepID=A0ABP0YEE8_9ROSI